MAPFIDVKVEAGLSAQRIYQDLVLEHGFADSYQSVQRFVRQLKEAQPERVWRLECQPGEEAQIDFGLGAPIFDSKGSKGRRTWVFRVVLSYSRKGYSEAVTRIEAGKFSRSLGAGGLNAPVGASCRYWVSRAAVLGEHCAQWAQAAMDARGPEALRSLMALCGLIKKHSATALNGACAKALKTGTHRLKDVKRFLGDHAEQTCFGFVEDHPLIRDLKTYSDFIHLHSHNLDPTIHEEHPQTTCP